MGFKIIKAEPMGDFSAPATAGEIAADTPAQAEHRALIARKRVVEREIAVKNSLFNSYSLARDRQRQLELCAELDALEAELHYLREQLGATGSQNSAAPNEQVVKSAEALAAILLAPSIKKAELPDPFDLSNGFGLRSQPRIK